jgi:hypothetical protein
MERITVRADRELLARLRALARERKVSLAEVVREALDEKAKEFRPKPKIIGMFSSDRSDGSMAASEPQPPVSWR